MDVQAGDTVTDDIKPGLYRHYKGNYYRVFGLATHSESLEEMVVYQALYGTRGLWVRPKRMFVELVCIDGQLIPRFSYAGEEGPTEA